MGFLASLLAGPSSTVSNPSPSLLRALGGGRTHAGAAVSEHSALCIPAVYAAIGILTDSVGMLPIGVFERTKSGKRSLVHEHPAVWMLKAEPNEHMSSMIFRSTVQGHAVAWGNGYAEIERNGRGEAVHLWPLLPDRTEPTVERGELRYFTKIEGQRLAIRTSDVVHVPAFGFDGYRGYSPIWLARQALALALATEEFGAKFFGQGSRSGGVLKLPKTISKEAEQRLKADWSTENEGLSNAHRIRVLYEGAEFSQTTIPPEDAQFLETRKFQLGEIARMFRVPPHMLADLERATFSNIEHQGLSFVTHTLNPWLVRWEQELDRKLFIGSERGRFYVKFNVAAFLRGDAASRAAHYGAGIKDGWLTRNEARELEDLDALEGLDAPLRPLNMVEQGEEVPE